MRNNHSFGENLKTLRQNRKITQGNLAKVLNITLKTVSHWETNYSEPSIEQLIFLADFFEISLDELVDRK